MHDDWIQITTDRNTAPTPASTCSWSSRCWRPSTSWPTATTSRYDSTSNKQFSLSDQTIKVVKDLKQRRQAHLLRRDHALPAGARPAGPLQRPLAKLKVDFIDPVKKPQQATRRYRLRPRHDPGGQRHAQGRSQEPHRRRNHRRADPLAEDRRAQCLLRRAAPASTASTTPAAPATRREADPGEEQLQDRTVIVKPVPPDRKPGHRPGCRAGRGGSAEGLHRAGRRRTAGRLPAARRRCLQEVRRRRRARPLHAGSAAEDRPRRDRAGEHRWSRCSPTWGVTLEQGPGARPQRHRPASSASAPKSRWSPATNRTPSSRE